MFVEIIFTLSSVYSEGQGVVLIVVGLVLRTVASFLSSLGNKFSLKEMIFISIAWIPKATVQVCFKCF